ncbi:MAG: GyrI-like domain-containing protein [Bacteroidota bacterium]|nr:GyrI-like domain-containing protein [Bacteroidota bacterium]
MIYAVKRIDLKKEWKHLYSPSAGKVEVVDVPEFLFVMVDGTACAGELPAESREFQDAVTALYGISYTLKFLSKGREGGAVDYPVMGLEGLWWTDSGDFDFAHGARWYWTLMIMQPPHITPAMFAEALRALEGKKKNPATRSLRLERLREGLCMQTMHIGPYSEEPRTMEKMKSFAETNGYIYRGRHHEIYIGDPRRAKPEKLRTILRQPVERKP